MFITFEGGEGAGKSTVLRALAEEMEQAGKPVLVTREPGGNAVAERIRGIVLDPAHPELEARTEALLYAAARRQHLAETIWPHLEAGGVVLCDRFVDSSIVYQGFARGLGVDVVREINRFATEDTAPDVTLYFDIAPSEGLARIAADGKRENNRLDQESLDFHESVRQMYLQLQQEEPERIVRIDASGTLADVTDAARNAVQKAVRKK
ncbi:dTMP kinase [Alkalicoccus chagannorensis]|uniref:dTMP kinase n=1 Tax=Alkalicoccus chagannorensis TaxID=427072 RepID=UPI00040257C4|nr:dTMP kinase [Alkalicoccus chagannorensis]